MLTRPSSRALMAYGPGVEMNGGTFAPGNEWSTCDTSLSVMNANTSSVVVHASAQSRRAPHLSLLVCLLAVIPQTLGV